MTKRRVVVSGGTGFVGRFIVERLLAEGFAITVLGRTPPAPGYFSKDTDFVAMALGAPMPARVFDDVAAFVHAAFDHVAGRYRGGEGDDADGFRRRNLEGSAALFGAARAAGVGRVVFLSSRAVYGSQPAGAVLTEATEPHPDTLYGTVKLEAERHLLGLAASQFVPTVLRVTGVYGPAGTGRDHKWEGLFRDYLAGRPVAPRVATEVHGDDVAGAIALVLGAPPDKVAGETFNVSDLVLDRRDLLAIVRAKTGSPAPLPGRDDAGALNPMATARLRNLGWVAGGMPLLEATMERMMASMSRAEKG